MEKMDVNQFTNFSYFVSTKNIKTVIYCKTEIEAKSFLNRCFLNYCDARYRHHEQGSFYIVYNGKISIYGSIDSANYDFILNYTISKEEKIEILELKEEKDFELEKFSRKFVKTNMKNFVGTKNEMVLESDKLRKEAKIIYLKNKKDDLILQNGIKALDLNSISMNLDDELISTTFISNEKNGSSYRSGKTKLSKDDEFSATIALAVAYYYSKFDSKTQAQNFANELLAQTVNEGGLYKPQSIK